MGSYGIGVERILCAAIELYADKDGMSMPASIAPFEVVITPVNYSDSDAEAGRGRPLERCSAAGLDAVLDDRDERPGVKFKDADLVGIPYRITIGKKLAQGLVEVVERRTKQSADVPLAEAAQYVHERIHQRLIGRLSERNSLPWRTGPFSTPLPTGNCRNVGRCRLRRALCAGGMRLHVRIFSSGSMMQTRFGNRSLD